MTMQHEEDFLPSAHEEQPIIDEGTLEAVTGGGDSPESSSGKGKAFSTPPTTQPGDWAVIGRTDSGRKVYHNAFAVYEAKDAKENPENWKVETTSIPWDKYSTRGGYVIRPK